MTKTTSKTTLSKNLMISTLLLGGVLLAGACGGGDVATGDAAKGTKDKVVMDNQPVSAIESEGCQVSITAVAGNSGLRGVISMDQHDVNPGTPNTLEFEVSTGMFAGTCADRMELYVNGDPARLLRANGESATFLASVSVQEPEVLLTAYCGQCKQGVWGAVVE
jgi:hypothetical protein